MRAMVFAAGLGTRLRPMTDVLPKPVVPLFHRPLCWFALDHLRRADVTDVVLNTHHLAARVEEAVASAPRIDGLTVRFAHEPTLLGTGGGVKHAIGLQSRALGRELADDDVVLAFNGDISFAPDLHAAIATHRATNAIATMIVREDPAAARYGAIELDEERVVRRMLATPDGTLRATMFTGVHVLSGRALRELPDEGCIVQRGYLPWLARGARIGAHVERAAWRDLGTPREYVAAHLDVIRGALAWPGIDPARDAVHPSASLGARVALHETTVGAGARIEDGVTLERCVVWPGTRVTESARDLVLLGAHRVSAV
ncbi:nucleotidyltransferase family protein [Sandaracinus amylolyticus]|uniref:nucleotidyltransferase family protein n=1 Tax=Sandaracinus amylolyticus TaxID=927083 RepID=UPI001F3549E2|nr:NDP-sugar synthase [Sandaracinus amylolyticus]UJR80440.1 Nucleotidyl transferase [Sandaracinus amylolyticus]